MNLQAKRIFLTGASGGIGQAVAFELAKHGARLGLVGTRQAAVNNLSQSLRQQRVAAIPIVADITNHEGREHAIQCMHSEYGGIDVLINNAGVMDFTEFSHQDPEAFERIFKVNVLAPMQLTRAILPEMLSRGDGQIVNVGSTFGSIAFACYTSYSASKFALRGFSEALRRELADEGVGVTYIAPRAVKTSMNSDAVYKMAKKTKMNMDDPAKVAQKIVHAIEKGKKDVYLGFPESLFVRINSLLPRLVDAALHRQNQLMREFTPINSAKG